MTKTKTNLRLISVPEKNKNYFTFWMGTWEKEKIIDVSMVVIRKIKALHISIVYLQKEKANSSRFASIHEKNKKYFTFR